MTISSQQQRTRKTNDRWRFLNSTWLPLLRDLHRTVGVLDREEGALQAEERKKEEADAVAQDGQGAAGR